MPRTVRTLLAVLALTFAVAAPALADSATITVTDASGRSDPVAGVGRTFTVVGNSALPRELYVRYRPVGGAACAPSADTDSGASFGFYGEDVNGDFRKPFATTWTRTGQFLFCVWIADDEDTPTTPIPTVISFRSPGGTVGGTVTPASVAPDQQATLSVTGSSEAPTQLNATIRPAGGAPCAPSADADSGSELVYEHDVNGAFNHGVTLGARPPGTYLVCLWLADSWSGTATAGPQPVTYAVVAPPAPPPPCTVPRLAGGTALSTVAARLTQASCTLGAQTLVASSRYARGTLVRLVPRAGTELPNAAGVALRVSDGPACVVPRVPRRIGVRAARARLVTAGCRAGRTSRVRSRTRRRGDVVGFTVRAGRRLPPRTVVGIRVSRGRR